MGNPQFAPWVELGRKLGMVISKLENSTSGTYTVAAAGNEISNASKLLVSAVAHGVVMGRGLPSNMISAMSILKQSGVEVTWFFCVNHNNLSVLTL